MGHESALVDLDDSKQINPVAFRQHISRQHHLRALQRIFTMVANRQLGKNGPVVPALGLGLMGMSFWAMVPFPVTKNDSRSSIVPSSWERHFGIHPISMATMRSCWASGSDGLESVTRSFLRPNSALFREENPTRSTALPNIARKLVKRASKDWGSIRLTFTICTVPTLRLPSRRL